VQESDLSAVAVTIGPGLSLCLRVGVRKARDIARAHRLPLVPIHHMEAHALVARFSLFSQPSTCKPYGLVSGANMNPEGALIPGCGFCECEGLQRKQ
jgi:tRNA A37 threonylcarbamoyltransferase TsaD